MRRFYPPTKRLCGYNPGDPTTDRGGVELDILNAWRTAGVAGDKIAAYVAIDPTKPTEVQQAIALFGGVYIGAALPVSAQNQTVWDTIGSPADAGTWGGHCTIGAGYYAGVSGNWFHRMFYGDTTKAGIVMVTWGTTKRATWDWIAAYVDEMYAIVTPDWIEAEGKSPSGFDLATLEANLRQ